MDLQLSINELLNSNHLTEEMAQGALLQINLNEFVLFLGAQTKVSGQTTGYSVLRPKFWGYLDSNSEAFDLYKYEKFCELTREQLLKLVIKMSSEDSKQIQLTSVQSFKDEFMEQFKWSKEKFKTQELKKTVPITLFEVKQTENEANQYNWWSRLKLAIEKQTFGWIYATWNSNQVVLGVTPELLAAYENKTWQTMALAGTWSTTDRVRVLSDVDRKTQNEHQFVIDDILSRWPKATAHETTVNAMPVISHLKTIIVDKSHVGEVNDVQKILNLHPTAALGVYPRKMSLVKEFAQLSLQLKRDYFGAPFGFLKFDSNNQLTHASVIVSIRQFIWNKNERTLQFFMGCGVTQESEFESEWHELNKKFEAVCSVFNFQRMS